MRKILKKNRKSIILFLKDRKGLSPIIIEVLLVALVLGITSVLFLWFRGMVEEGVTKFGKNIQLVCGDLNYEASYSAGTLNIINNGNIPIFKVNIRISSGGSYQTRDLTEVLNGNSWPDSGLPQGGTFTGDIGGAVGGANKIIVLPVLVGASSKGKKTFECGEQYGKELNI